MLLMLAVLLAACSEDAGDSTVTPVTPEKPTPSPGGTTEDDGDLLQLVAYGQQFSDVSQTSTRAITPDNYDPYEGPNSIGVFMIKQETNEAPDEVSTFSWEKTDETTGKWVSQVEVKNIPYYIYGYMPAGIAQTSYSISMMEGKTSYADGATLTFKGLPPVSEHDFCLLTGVQDMNTDKDADVELKRGIFEYEGRLKGQNFVRLMFDHLYTGILFQMKVGPKYDELRTIKLKKFKLLTTQVYIVSEWKLNVVPNATGDDPVSLAGQSLTPMTTGSEATLFESEEGQELDVASAYEVSGYFFPVESDGYDVSRQLAIECTYDVYDKKGNLIRQDCVAKNSLPAMAKGRGHRTKITLTVEPTYLYVLSDPDLDNPTVVVN